MLTASAENRHFALIAQNYAVRVSEFVRKGSVTCKESVRPHILRLYLQELHADSAKPFRPRCDDGQPIAGAPFYAEVIAPMLVDRDSRFEARLEHIDIKRETLKRIGPVHYELEQVSKIDILRKFRKRFGAKTIHDIRFRVG